MEYLVHYLIQLYTLFSHAYHESAASERNKTRSVHDHVHEVQKETIRRCSYLCMETGEG